LHWSAQGGSSLERKRRRKGAQFRLVELVETRLTASALLGFL